jgi:transposase
VERIAIDLGSRESQICVRNDQGTILEERRHLTSQLGRYLAKREPGGRVLLESSSEAFAVAEWARQSGHEARVVPSILVRALGVGERGLKNDQRDARKLSEMDCRMDVPSIHIPSTVRRDQRARLTTRDALVAARTQLVNVLRSYRRTLAMPPLRAATPKTIAGHVRDELLRSTEGLPDYIEDVLATLDTLNERISRANEAIKEIAEADPDCRRLQTMPGVGSIVSMSVVTSIDDVSRFDGPSKVGSYFGLTPGENTTGFRTKRTNLTKAGCSRARWTLVQAAWTMVRTRPKDPIVLWFQSVAGRRGKKIAITALARKMAGILYAMWRSGMAYNPQLAAKTMTS